jgi:transcriptional regulator with XRE-family HTH domain
MPARNREPSEGLLRILSANIVRLRNLQGWSQEELADEAGLHRTFVGSVERGERNVTLSTLEALAARLSLRRTIFPHMTSLLPAEEAAQLRKDFDVKLPESPVIMGSPRQGDLFGSDHPDPSGDDFETPTYYPDLDEVRAELQKILAEMRAAKSRPWYDSRAALYRTIFPQMTGCLPEDEGAQLRFEFEEQLVRLKRGSYQE